MQERILNPVLKSASSRPGLLSTRFRILQRDGFKCRYCSRSLLTSGENVELVVDYIHPRAKGGSDSEDNLITSLQ
ncbi:HNH endonuclease [Leptolyngbya sp. FACHB-541]|nr:HNH endonuclease [Leptolyngbya sp. FACHB-541]